MIYRVNKQTEFSMILNDTLRDDRLSWEARGMLAYLLTHSDGWKLRPTDLLKQSPCGRDKNRRIVRELEEFGYIVRYRCAGDDGQFNDWGCDIHEKPTKKESEELEIRQTEKPSVGEPVDIRIPTGTKEQVTDINISVAEVEKPKKKHVKKTSAFHALDEDKRKIVADLVTDLARIWEVDDIPRGQRVVLWMNPVAKHYALLGDAQLLKSIYMAAFDEHKREKLSFKSPMSLEYLVSVRVKETSSATHASIPSYLLMKETL